jgi:hypothetical protein
MAYSAGSVDQSCGDAVIVMRLDKLGNFVIEKIEIENPSAAVELRFSNYPITQFPNYPMSLLSRDDRSFDVPIAVHHVLKDLLQA